MTRFLIRRIAAVLAVSAGLAGPAIAEGSAFSGGVSYNSDVGLAVAISPDKKAFTATFSGLTAVIDGPQSLAPVASRQVSFVLPIQDFSKDEVMTVFVSGFVSSQAGADAHVVVTVNEQTSSLDFYAAEEKEFLQKIEYKPGTAREVRITIFVLASRNSKSGAAVSAIVNSVDNDLAKHK